MKKTNVKRLGDHRLCLWPVAGGGVNRTKTKLLILLWPSCLLPVTAGFEISWCRQRNFTSNSTQWIFFVPWVYQGEKSPVLQVMAGSFTSCRLHQNYIRAGAPASATLKKADALCAVPQPCSGLVCKGKIGDFEGFVLWQGSCLLNCTEFPLFNGTLKYPVMNVQPFHSFSVSFSFILIVLFMKGSSTLSWNVHNKISLLDFLNLSIRGLFKVQSL